MLGSAPNMEKAIRKLILGLVFLFPGLPVAAQQTDPDVIWKGDFESGASSLTGHCSPGDDQWCVMQATRPQQIQVVPDPVAQGKYAVRFEVKYGDLFSYYSDSRSMLSGPPALWEDEGNERWYRWQALWPQDWVGSYPKWDELWNPSARSWGGSLVVWHHDANGGVERGSAPLYIGAEDTDIWLCLVDQATSECRACRSTWLRTCTRECATTLPWASIGTATSAIRICSTRTDSACTARPARRASLISTASSAGRRSSPC
ncbi:MAG: hypothetical protein E6I99_16245 [Chloroflexi bacterium]|nr:MAG: hypothetical protein E6I99_16245 [Chloroflexota bacterium]